MTDKEIYIRARCLFEAENPGRRFSQGPAIRPPVCTGHRPAAEPVERETYISRARSELARQQGASPP